MENSRIILQIMNESFMGFSLGGRRNVKTTQLIRKKGVYSNMYKLHVSAKSGHHQVFYRFKRKSYIWVGVLIKRSLLSNFVILKSGVVTVYSTITIPKSVKKPDDGHCWPKHVVYTY